MKWTSIHSSLQITGAPNAYIPEVMNRFRVRDRLNFADGTPDDEINRRAVRFLEPLVRKAAADNMQQLLSGTLEWRKMK